MKRCPECRRDYYDDTLLYCLEDGIALVQGPVASPTEPQTAILHKTEPQDESRTKQQIDTMGHTGDLTTPDLSLRPGRRRSGSKLWMLGAVVLLGAIGAGAYYLMPLLSGVQTKPGANMKITRLVTGLDGLPSNVSISPDGRFVAYGLVKDGKQALWIRQVAQQNAVEIVKPVEGANFLGIQFSPDGNTIISARTSGRNDIVLIKDQMKR